LLIGTFAFAGAFPWLEPLTTAGELQAGARLPDVLGIPEWLILALLTAAAVMVFVVGAQFERRAREAGRV